jgi:hypothetical protein
VRFALEPKNLGDGPVFATLDLLIQVEECPTQFVGKALPAPMKPTR